MKRAVAALIASALVVLSSAVASASGVPPLGRITYLTPQVSPNGILTVRASVTPRNASCTLVLHGPESRVVSLNAQRRQSGKLQWTYLIPEATQGGSWMARLSCGGRMVASRGFAVSVPILTTNVIVVNSGFTQSNPAGFGQPFISYGIVLKNEATDADALNDTITVSFADTLGTAVATETADLTGIPAGATFYLGGLAGPNISLTVASMNVSVTVGSEQSPQLQLPLVTGLSLQPASDGFGDGITGIIQNPATTATASDAEIYVVYLNAQGDVIGGASEYAGAAISPGSSVPFSFSEFSTDIDTDFVPPSDVGSIDGSVNP